MDKNRLNAVPVLAAIAVVMLGLVSLPAMTYLSMQKQEVRTLAACKEECPGSDGILRSCTPPDSDGTPNESLCSSKGRKEICGGKTYCCPSAGGKWTTTMTACTSTTTPTPTSVPTATTTPTATPVPACVDTSWSPDPATKCVSQYFYQTSNCNRTRLVSGTKTGGNCCTDTTWTPSSADQCKGVSFTQTSNCGNVRTATGSNASGSCCTDTKWTPDATSVCGGKSVTQTSNCGRTRTIVGNKTSAECCVPTGKITCDSACPTKCGYAGGDIICRDSCGKAVTRTCAGTPVCGIAEGSCDAVNGGWSEWGLCSAVACGESGVQTRTCNSPVASCGGRECVGDWIQSCVAEDCNLTTTDNDPNKTDVAQNVSGPLPDISAGTEEDNAEAVARRAEIFKTILTMLGIGALLIVLFFVYKKIKKQDEEERLSASQDKPI